MNHEIDISKINIRTDLAVEEVVNVEYLYEEIKNNIKITTVLIDDSNKHKFLKKKGKYVTIEFKDATDYNNCKELEKIFIEELNKFLIDYNIMENNTCLIVGLGNEKVSADSLGPKSVNNIIVTNHLYFLGLNVEEGFRSVAAIKPGVMGQTGLETFDIVNSLVKEIKPDFLIVIDSLKASCTDKINKIIQITDAGINPGSGIGNNRKEISKDVLNIPVFAIGIPTVVDTITIVNDSINNISNYYSYMKKNINNPSEKLKIIRTKINNICNIDDKKELFGLIGTLNERELKKFISEILIPIGYNMIVTSKDIDYQIEKLSNIISNGINNTLHKNVNDL